MHVYRLLTSAIFVACATAQNSGARLRELEALSHLLILYSHGTFAECDHALQRYHGRDDSALYHRNRYSCICGDIDVLGSPMWVCQDRGRSCSCGANRWRPKLYLISNV